MSMSSVAPVQDDLRNVRKNVSKATIVLLIVLTLTSIAALHEMADMTHAANWFTAWGVAVGIGATLAVLSYVASVTDGKVRKIVTVFAVVAAGTSATLQISLFLQRGADPWVAVAFGAGIPFFEIALALTDSMLRRYTVAAPSQTVQETPQATKGRTGRSGAPTPHSDPVAGAGDNLNDNEYAETIRKPAPARTNSPVKLVAIPTQLQGMNDDDLAELLGNRGVTHATQVEMLASKGDAELAEIFGVSRQAVNGWRNNGKLQAQIAKRLPDVPNVGAVTVNGNGVHA